LRCDPVLDLSFRVGRKIIEANPRFLLRGTQPHNSTRSLNRLLVRVQSKAKGQLRLGIQFGRCVEGQSARAKADDDAAIPGTKLNV
jgi:hypothetical protein